MVDSATLVLEAGQSIGRVCLDTLDIAGGFGASHTDNSCWDMAVEGSFVVDDVARVVDSPDTPRIAVVACEQEMLYLDQMETVLNRGIRLEEACFHEPEAPFAWDIPEEDMEDCLAQSPASEAKGADTRLAPVWSALELDHAWAVAQALQMSWPRESQEKLMQVAAARHVP